MLEVGNQAHKTKMMRREEERLGRPLEDILPETYERLGTLEATGQALGINPNTLYLWMIRLGIRRRMVLVRPGDDGQERPNDHGN